MVIVSAGFVSLKRYKNVLYKSFCTGYNDVVVGSFMFLRRLQFLQVKLNSHSPQNRGRIHLRHWQS